MKKLWFTVLVFVFVIACASCNKKVDFDSLELNDVIDYSLVTVSRVSRNAYDQVDYDNSSINDGKKLSDVDYAYLKSFYKTLGEQYRMSPEDMKASYSLNRFDSYYMQSVFHHYYFYPNQTLINYVDFRIVRKYEYASKF